MSHDDAYPGLVPSRPTPGNSTNMISMILNNIMQNHRNHRINHAKPNLKHPIPPLLPFTRNQTRPIRIQDLGQGAENAHQRP